MISHGFVFSGDAVKQKEHRNVEMGCFGAVGVEQKTLTVGKMLQKVRVSVHRSRGMMACSPNNAVLNVLPTSDLRRFFLLIRDGERTELTLNVLLSEESSIESIQNVLTAVAKISNQTTVRDLCESIIKQDDANLIPVLDLFNTHL